MGVGVVRLVGMGGGRFLFLILGTSVQSEFLEHVRVLLFFLNRSLLEYKCFTILCVVSVVQQSESAICIHMSPYPLPVGLEESIL